MMDKRELVDRFEDASTVIGFCTVETLNSKDIFVAAYRKGMAKKPKDYLPDAKTIVVVGNAVEFSEEVFRRIALSGNYPGYGRVFKISKEIEGYLRKHGFKAKVAHNINQKTAAVQAGLGVWAKNSLVLNERFGTHLRLDTIMTTWVPNEYSKPLGIDLCSGCNECISACPFGCLENFKFDAKRCFNKYIKKSELHLEIPMCSVCQKACKYNKFR